MIVLDTNIVIQYLQGKSEVTHWLDGLRNHGEHFAISATTVLELLAFPKINDSEIWAVEQWLPSVLIVDVDLPLAREAARLRRQFKLNAIDAIIAATAVLLNSSLATQDLGFKKVRNIKVVKP